MFIKDKLWPFKSQLNCEVLNWRRWKKWRWRWQRWLWWWRTWWWWRRWWELRRGNPSEVYMDEAAVTIVVWLRIPLLPGICHSFIMMIVFILIMSLITTLIMMTWAHTCVRSSLGIYVSICFNFLPATSWSQLRELVRDWNWLSHKTTEVLVHFQPIAQSQQMSCV